LHIVFEEADESVFWHELIIEKDLLPKNKIISLLNEVDELTNMFSKSYYTAKRKKSPNQ